VDFEIIDEIRDIETIGVNTSIRELDRTEENVWQGTMAKAQRNCACAAAELAEFVGIALV